jgi:squalene cyclase
MRKNLPDSQSIQCANAVPFCSSSPFVCRGGKYASEAASIVSRMLLKEQSANGSWLSQRGEERNYGEVYATSLAILSLSVTCHYLPSYQR